MRYILVKTRVHTGTPNNTLSLLVLTKTGWAPWSEVEGKTNCTDPNLCPVVSFSDMREAWKEVSRDDREWDYKDVVAVPVDVDNPGS